MPTSLRPVVRPLVPCLVVALLALAAGHAQEPTGGEPSLFTEDVVVSANLTETPLDEVGTSVTIIGPEEIAARDKSTLIELLRTVPGLTAVVQGGPGRVGSVLLRGGASSHTLVLLDGVRLNSAGTGAFDFADMPAENIERIEILRGPQSSLYGSEALAGVVNIVTKRARAGLHGAVRAEVGTESARRAAASIEGADDRFDWRVTAGNERLPGYSLAAAERGDETFNPYRNTHAALAAGMRVGREGRADATLHYVDARVHPDSFGLVDGRFVPVAAPEYVQDREALSGGASLEIPVTRRWRQIVRAGIANDELVGSNPGNVYENYELRSRVASATLQADLDLPARHTLSIGYSHERRAAEDAGQYDASATIDSFFVQDQWSWNGRVFLTGSLRNDEHSVFGGRTTGRATAAVRVPEAGTRLHASWGTGFKAPTMVDLYYPYYGNPALRPEEATAWDAGLAQAFADGRVGIDVTYFHHEVRDLISADPVTFAAVNIGRARLRGVEARAGWTASPVFSLDASVTYSDAEDLATGQALARRPRRQAAVSAHVRPTAALSGLLAVIMYDDRVEFDGTPMEDIRRVDLALDYRLASRVSLRARVQDLLDAADVEVPGYRSPGRLASLGIDLTF